MLGHIYARKPTKFNKFYLLRQEEVKGQIATQKLGDGYHKCLVDAQGHLTKYVDVYACL